MNRGKSLTGFRMINWHNCSDSGVIDLTGDTLLTGPTGSGKSTLLDAMYLVLTLNEHHFNKASGNDAKRDLRGYVRCQKNEKIGGRTQKYKRKGKVISYILAEIYDARNNVNVIGTCFVSASDTSDIERHYFVIKNNDLKDIELVDKNMCPLEFKVFGEQFDKNNFNSPKTKTEAKKLFANVLGFKKDQVFMYEKLCHVLAKILSGKEGIVNVDEFIKENILFADALDIETIEAILKDLIELEARLAEYEKREAALKEVRELISEHHMVTDKIRRDDVLYVVSNYEHLNKELITVNSDIEKLHREDNLCNEEMEANALRRDEYKEQKFRMENMDEKQQLAEFNKEKEKLEKRYFVCDTAQKNLALKMRQLYEFTEVNRRIKTLFKTNFDWSDTDLSATRLNAFLGDLEAFQETLTTEIFDSRKKKKDIQFDYNALKIETDKLRSGLSASHMATDALKAINKHFAEHWIKDEAKVLCDCIDFNTEDNQWKSTLEAFLGKVRFHVVVKPENYQIAKEIIMKGRFYNVSIIDTTSEFDRTSRKGSICDLFSYSNEYVEEYLKYAYGGIMAVESCLYGVPDAQFKYLGKDGTTYGGRVFSTKNTKVQYYIGQDAKNKLMKENMAILDEQKDQMREITNEIDVYENVISIVKKVVYEINNLDKTIFDDLKNLPDEIETLKANIRDLTSEDAMFDAQKRIMDIQAKIQECDQKQKTLRNKQNAVLRKLGVAEEKKSEDELRLKNIKPYYLNYQESAPEEFEKAKKEYENILSDSRKTVKSVSRELEAEKQKNESRAEEINRRLVIAERTYCDLYNSSLSFEGIDSAEEYEKEYVKIAIEGIPELKDKIQRKRNEEVNAIKNNIMKYFKKGFSEAERMTNYLNRFLRDATYGGRTYLLTRPEAALGYEKYYNLIKDAEIPGYPSETGVEHTDEEFEEFYRFVREHQDHMDYRSYIKCDVAVKRMDDGHVTEQRLSESLAVSSGGEKQIPLYILSAMALLSIYVEDKTNDILRFAMLDEAFSFIDKTNTESVLGYFNAIQLQTILGVPDRMAYLFTEYTDNQIYVLNSAAGTTFKSLPSQRKFITFNKID